MYVQFMLLWNLVRQTNRQRGIERFRQHSAEGNILIHVWQSNRNEGKLHVYKLRNLYINNTLPRTTNYEDKTGGRRGMVHIWKESDEPTQIWSENLKERNNFWGPGRNNDVMLTKNFMDILWYGNYITAKRLRNAYKQIGDIETEGILYSRQKIPRNEGR